MDNIHRSYGIPDDIMRILGPPAVATEEERQRYFILLAEYNRENRARNVADWMAYADAALDRIEISRNRCGASVTERFFEERAAKELSRPAGVRFLPIDLGSGSGELAKEPSTVEAEQGIFDWAEVDKVLAEKGLDRAALNLLAGALAAKTLGPIHARELALRKSERASLDSVARRRADEPSAAATGVRKTRKPRLVAEDEALLPDDHSAAQEGPSLSHAGAAADTTIQDVAAEPSVPEAANLNQEAAPPSPARPAVAAPSSQPIDPADDPF